MISGSLLLLIVGVCYLAYQIAFCVSTGWYRLEKSYRTPVRMGFKMGSGPVSLNEDRPNGRLRVWASLTPAQEGLYLSMPWFLSLMCPPLLIPWKDFVLAPSKGLGSEFRSVKLHLRDGDNMVVMRDEYLGIEPYLHHLPHRPMPAKAPAASARIG